MCQMECHEMLLYAVAVVKDECGNDKVALERPSRARHHTHARSSILIRSFNLKHGATETKWGQYTKVACHACTNQEEGHGWGQMKYLLQKNITVVTRGRRHMAMQRVLAARNHAVTPAAMVSRCRPMLWSRMRVEVIN